MYKTVEEVGDNVLDKAKDLYQTLDEATGGKVQRFRDRLDNIRQQLNGLTGTEEDAAKEASLLKAQKETEEAMQEAFAEAKTKGVDPDTLKQADQIFKQSQALYDLDTAVQRSTSGKPAGVGTKGLPETVDPKKLAPRVTALWKSDRLQQALGEEHATDLMDYVGEAAKHQQTAIKIKGFLKMAGIATGLLGGGTVVGHVVHALGQ
jgi:DNA repair exonuclease SbcCD ATPase subunit